MRSAGPHISVVVACANKHTQVLECARTIHLQDSIAFLFPRLETSGSKPVTEPVGFSDCPLAFEWINGKTIVLELLQNLIYKLEVVRPGGGECAYIINVNFSVVEITKDNFHNVLHNIGGAFQSHWQTIVFEFIKRGHNCA